MSMTKKEIIRIRNLGCGNEWPKVWNRQLYELCDIALRQSAETERDAALREVEEITAHDAKMERERNECLAVVKGLDCYLHLLGSDLVDRIRSIILQDEIAEYERQRMAGFPVEPHAALAEKGKP